MAIDFERLIYGLFRRWAKKSYERRWKGM